MKGGFKCVVEWTLVNRTEGDSGVDSDWGCGSEGRLQESKHTSKPRSRWKAKAKQGREHPILASRRRAWIQSRNANEWMRSEGAEEEEETSTAISLRTGPCDCERPASIIATPHHANQANQATAALQGRRERNAGSSGSEANSDSVRGLWLHPGCCCWYDRQQAAEPACEWRRQVPVPASSTSLFLYCCFFSFVIVASVVVFCIVIFMIVGHIARGGWCRIWQGKGRTPCSAQERERERKREQEGEEACEGSLLFLLPSSWLTYTCKREIQCSIASIPPPPPSCMSVSVSGSRSRSLASWVSLDLSPSPSGDNIASSQCWLMLRRGRSDHASESVVVVCRSAVFLPSLLMSSLFGETVLKVGESELRLSLFFQCMFGALELYKSKQNLLVIYLIM